jgi:hypothetical protein
MRNNKQRFSRIQHHKTLFYALLILLPYIHSVDPDNVSAMNILKSIQWKELIKLFTNGYKSLEKTLFVQI